jgi:cytoplasmic iron level regulating protein YaaA (DUF328/UPF0246 family)
MLILLPPSETKRDGGDEGTKLDYRRLRFPELQAARRATVSAVRTLSRDREASIRALGLGPTQHDEVARNRAIGRSATMAAVDRYTGVLFDALDAGSLDDGARAYLAENVVIHSAVLGPIGALDPIPAYRLSHDSRLPGLRLKALWAGPAAKAIARSDGLILDARSEAYAELGPAPAEARSAFLRVVSEDDGGRRRALNHFNKHAKGELVRSLALAGERFDSVDGLLAWGRRNGVRLEPGQGTGPGGVAELLLVV